MICEECMDDIDDVDDIDIKRMNLESCFRCGRLYCMHSEFFHIMNIDGPCDSGCHDCIKELMNEGSKQLNNFYPFYFSIDSIISYTKEKDEKIDNLLKTIDELTQKLAHLKYMPGGEGANEAERHFKELVDQKN